MILRINPNKTEGMWIRSFRENKTKPLIGIKWQNEPIKAPRVYYSDNQKLLHEKKLHKKPGQR